MILTAATAVVHVAFDSYSKLVNVLSSKAGTVS
jgi:hypothetical protein